jgi:nicotinamidase-related amidase
VNDSDLTKSCRPLLLVDFINSLDFPGSEDLAAPALEAAKATAKLARAARAAEIPVIYANDNFGIWRSDFNTMGKRLGKSGRASASIVKLLELHARHSQMQHQACRFGRL